VAVDAVSGIHVTNMGIVTANPKTESIPSKVPLPPRNLLNNWDTPAAIIHPSMTAGIDS
jgi:hypothetical protein